MRSRQTKTRLFLHEVLDMKKIAVILVTLVSVTAISGCTMMGKGKGKAPEVVETNG